jgi:alkylated DNA repair dioxygenase AlkB
VKVHFLNVVRCSVSYILPRNAERAGTGVVIISLGAERHIYYRRKSDKEIKYKYLLKNGSLLAMDKQVQDEWMHAIPKENGIGERISLTFRNIIK